MLSFISKYKYALLMMVLVFTPTSAVVFSILGIVSGFINWGLLILVGLVVAAIKLNGKYDLREMLSDRQSERQKEAVFNSIYMPDED
jgi:hypothetical protein